MCKTVWRTSVGFYIQTPGRDVCVCGSDGVHSVLGRSPNYGSKRRKKNQSSHPSRHTRFPTSPNLRRTHGLEAWIGAWRICILKAACCIFICYQKENCFALPFRMTNRCHRTRQYDNLAMREYQTSQAKFSTTPIRSLSRLSSFDG